MTIQQINETYNKLFIDINKKLEDLIDILDDTIIYELNQESIDEGSYDYYIDVYDNHGTSYEMSVEKVYKNGIIYGYINDLGEYWDIKVGEILNITDKLTILNILNNE